MRELRLPERARAVVRDGDPECAAVLPPCLNSTCDLPPLRYGAIALAARGWTVAQVSWDPPPDDDWIPEQARAALAALERAAAPTLLVGGTADGLWDGAVAARVPAEVLELESADHGLEVGDALASVELLGRVVRRLDEFVAGLP